MTGPVYPPPPSNYQQPAGYPPVPIYGMPSGHRAYAPAKKHHWLRWTLAGLGALMVVVGGIGIAVGGTQPIAGTTESVTTSAPAPNVPDVPAVKVAFNDGTFRVNSEIQAGTYHTSGAGSSGVGCYWQRSSAGDGLDAIIANNNIDGPTTIDINSSDYSFTTSGGCDWARI